VDASKDPSMFHLSQCRIELYVIHLIRDARPINSAKKMTAHPFGTIHTWLAELHIKG
jgi:hypothetical protein